MIVSRVLDEPKFTVEAAYSRVRSLYDVQHLTSQFTRLAEEIETFDPSVVDRDSLEKLGQSLDQLLRQLHRLKEILSGSAQTPKSDIR